MIGVFIDLLFRPLITDEGQDPHERPQAYERHSQE